MEKFLEVKGKSLADLRTAELRKLIAGWEKERDSLYDVISFKKGKVELLEELIHGSYERILDINKEVRLVESAAEKERLLALEKQQQELAFEQAKKSMKKKHPSDAIKDIQARRTAVRKKRGDGA